MPMFDNLVFSLFLISFFLMAYIYGGYLVLLRVLVFLFGKKEIQGGDKHEGFTPGVSVYLPVLNEEENIGARLENLLALDYSSERIEIIVISDGSSDGTVSLVERVRGENPSRDIKLIVFEENRGPSEAQNAATEAAKYDILVSTDAETRFSASLLKEIVRPFADKRVGVVGALVVYQPGGSMIGKSYGAYRNMETLLRRQETLLGICFKTDGPCMAYRKDAWAALEGFEDVDQVLPLIARKKGYITVQAEKAISFDRANTRARQEMAQRSRMTRKALFSIQNRWHIADIIKYPFFSFALFSHKLLRFFSPFLLLLWVISGMYIMSGHGLLPEFAVFSAASAALLLTGHFFKAPILSRISGHLISLIYSNIGFALGVLQWIARRTEGRYKPTHTY